MPKFRAFAILLAASASLAACVAVVPVRAPTTTATRTVATQASVVACDDGGSGGVLIDGVCL